jgi:hypothetical protein
MWRREAHLRELQGQVADVLVPHYNRDGDNHHTLDDNTTSFDRPAIHPRPE